ncbi:MAG: hypothetical protein ACPG19_11990 [Saprospiraceae bacterium]
MKKSLFILAIFFFFQSCKKEESNLQPHSYPVLNAINFMDSLYQVHEKHFRPIHKNRFLALCKAQNINPKDSSNQSKIFPLLFYHELFTLKMSNNCARSQIFDIAYFWHWQTPNPRHSIQSVATNKQLNELPPLPEKSLYQTYGDMDRTPSVYLKDLFEQPNGYYAEGCDSFSTFGWCSETEMSFTLLMEQIGYTGNVELSEGGNHSWSSFQMNLVLNDGSTKQFEIEVDNTYDRIRIDFYKKRPDSKILKMEKWYDEQSRDANEIAIVKHIIVPKKTSIKIEGDIIRFLKK